MSNRAHETRTTAPGKTNRDEEEGEGERDAINADAREVPEDAAMWELGDLSDEEDNDVKNGQQQHPRRNAGDGADERDALMDLE